MSKSDSEEGGSQKTGFVIDKVPGAEAWTWTLLDHNGDTLARAGKGYDTKQEAQIAIASTRIHARESEVPTCSAQTIE